MARIVIAPTRSDGGEATIDASAAAVPGCIRYRESVVALTPDALQATPSGAKLTR